MAKSKTSSLDQFNNKLKLRGTYDRLTDEQIARAEKRLGRALSPAEKLMGSLIRKPSPVFGSDEFRVRMLNAPTDDPFEEEHRRALEAVESEKICRMTDAERALHFVEAARAERKAAEQAEKDHEAKLKTFGPILANIDRLLEEARFDEVYGYSEIEALRDVREQILTVGACPVHAQEQFAICLKTHQVKTQGRRATTVAKMAELQAEQARLQAQVEALDISLGNRVPPKVTQAEVDAAYAEQKRLYDEDQAAGVSSMRWADAYRRYEKLASDAAAAEATPEPAATE